MIHDPDSRQRVIDLVDADPKAIRGRYERMPYGRFAIVSKGKVGWGEQSDGVRRYYDNVLVHEEPWSPLTQPSTEDNKCNDNIRSS